MSWLLELLLDGIGEICSQFIVDMMELITEMFTELLSCNLSLFEELFSVVSALYANVIVPMGIAILLLILMWQLFKSMFGKSVNSEEPIELIIRSAIALFFVVAAKPIVNYILKFAGTPYQWVAGTEIKVESFAGFVSALEGVTETLGIGKLSISLLMVLMQFVVAWNYFKMLFVIAERYVLLGVFSYTAPLAFATGGSKSTNNILASWSKMFGGQVVLIILNAWCMKMFLSGYGNMMASSYGFTKFFVATLCLVGFCKITFKLDSYMASLGVNLGRPSAGMGAMGLIMTASRIISQLGRGSGGEGGNSTPPAAEASGVSSGSGMTGGFTGPIPMNGGETYAAPMDMSEELSKEDFDGKPDTTDETYGQSGFDYEPEPNKRSSVLDELGVVATSETSTGGSAGTFQSDAGTVIGRNNGGEESTWSREGAGQTADEEGLQGNGFDEEVPMEMNFSNIPGYEAERGSADEIVGKVPTGETTETIGEIGMNDGLSGQEVSGENATGVEFGTDSGGIISEIGDYPVKRKDSDDMDAYDMDLDGNRIENMGSVSDAEGISYGSAGDAYGNTTLASRGRNTTGKGMNLQQSATSGLMPDGEEIDASRGIIDDVGTTYSACGIEANQAGDMPEMSEKIGSVSSGDKSRDMEQGSMLGGQAESGDLVEAAAIDYALTDGIHSESEALKADMSQERNPMEHMAGKMEHLDTGKSISAGMPRGHGKRKPSREFTEVPKTREELRYRQQKMKNQNQPDRLE